MQYMDDKSVRWYLTADKLPDVYTHVDVHMAWPDLTVTEGEFVDNTDIGITNCWYDKDGNLIGKSPLFWAIKAKVKHPIRN